MKQTLSFFTLALVLSGSAACSSENNNNTPAADTGVVDETSTDSSTTTDSGTPGDTGGSDTATPGCGTDLPSGYACPAFPAPATSTACTEALLQEFVAKCVTADFEPGSECAAWKTANAACKTCVEAWSWDDNKIFPDDYKCYEKLVPGCGQSINCTFACADEVCGLCKDDDSYDDCSLEANREGGRCHELAAKNADTCVADPKGAPCEVTQYYTPSPNLTKLKDEVVRVLRGACRDDGDWSKSGMGADDAGPGDSGDTGSDETGDTAVDDTGASDTAADDTGASDTASAD